MATQEELVQYIEQGLSRGFNIDYIKETLTQYGHDENRVNEAIKIVRDIKHPPAIEKHLEKFKKKKIEYGKVYIGIAVILVLIIIILATFNIKSRLSKKEIETTLEEVGKLSSVIDEKQDMIDLKIKEIQKLNLSTEDKEKLVQKQLEEVTKLNKYIKEERIKTRDLLLELMGHILKK